MFQGIGSSEIAPVSAMAEDLESKRRCVQGFLHMSDHERPISNLRAYSAILARIRAADSFIATLSSTLEKIEVRIFLLGSLG